MTEEQKGVEYGNLLNEHRRISNQIADIKSENFEMNPEQTRKIKVLENKQVQIMDRIKVLFN